MIKLNIHIVEDEMVIAMDIEDKLLNSGYIINGVTSSYKETLNYFEQTNIPDLVLMDIVISGDKSGIDLAKTIKSLYGIPVIFLTANSNKKILNEIKSANPYGFINKPFDVKDIISAIEVAHHKYLYEKSLRENEENLRLLNEKLEEQVSIRTKELQEKNNHLNEEIKLRNQIEKSLMFSEKLYRNTINNLGSGLVIANSSGKIIDVNNALVGKYNFEKDELINQDITLLLPVKQWGEIVSFFSVEDNETWYKEFKTYKSGGNKVWSKVYVSRSASGDGSSNYLFSVIDINLQKLNEKLLSEERKRRLKSYIEGEEKERKRVAKELHDSLGQKLTAVKLTLGSLLQNKQLEVNFKNIILDSKLIVEDAMHELREISQNLTPSVLNDFDLKAALEKICERFKHNTIQLNLNVSLNYRLPMEIETALYRIAQEGINNALKYAEPKSISIILKQEIKKVELLITDDGNGFVVNENAFKRGHGLNNIRERSEAIKAKLEITSEINKGTQLKVGLTL